jgi:hypothetical protein
MMRKRQQSHYAERHRAAPEDKVIGLGCIVASAGISFSMLAWIIQLLSQRVWPLY